jgi:hypothetical protein
MQAEVESEYLKYKKVQIQRINRDKWFEGERIKCDPGPTYIHWWIQQFAKNFRDGWNTSLCRGCVRCDDCGYEVKSMCDGYCVQS